MNYPPVWDTEGVRRYIENFERGAARLPSGQSVADRQLPERIAPRWMQPWNDLSPLTAILPRPVRTASWDKATLYLDDQGSLRAFADAPRRRFRDVDGSDLVLAMVPPFESVGYFDRRLSDRASGWFNPLLAPRDKVRIAIVADDRILAWAGRQDRPDVAAYFNRGEMTSSGFTAPVPSGAPHEALSAVAVIDGRIGIVVPAPET
jgi:hypothetical protein